MTEPATAAPSLLIDTDPGVDDALAILMAHAHADVVALSVAAGNTGLQYTVRNACTLVDLLDAATPVYAGCPLPLVRAPLEDAVQVHGTDGFGDIGLPAPAAAPLAEHAAAALIRLTRERPGELTLVALAPLTNIALAVRLDPQLPQRVKRLLVMGGAVHGDGNIMRTPAEFNIGFDPEAAHVVFDAFPSLDLVDWELCLRHAFADEDFDAWLAAGDARARLFGRIVGTARGYNAARGRRGLVAADALAMAVALAPQMVTRWATHHVDVELDGGLTRGMTVVDWEDRLGLPANARIAMDVDQAQFATLVRSALGA
ncbi:MAG TPA: nucleoside hydrolase [Rhodanobacteraceae bacterium]|nr:nucleoside hydrolase [Rhodanobacteraceae bacterium]